MKIIKTDPSNGELLRLTEEEEAELATCVFTLLSTRAFRGEDADFVKAKFWDLHARTGIPILYNDIVEFLEIVGRWQKKDYFKIPVPNLVLDDKGMYDSDNDQINVEVARIWYDVWLQFETPLSYIDDDYRRFSGMDLIEDVRIIKNYDFHFKRAGKYERAFWKEVKRAETDEGLIPSDAYLYALDTHPRGRDRIPMILMLTWLQSHEDRYRPKKRFHPHPDNDHRLVRRESE